MEKTGNLAKAASILSVLAAQGSAGATIARLAELSGISRPSTYRLVGMLETMGWVESGHADRKIHLGPELAVLAISALERFPLEALARPLIEEFSRKTGQTISLMRRVGDDAVCVGRSEGTGQIRTLLLEVGVRWPLGKGAAGMAILAALPEAEADAILLRNQSRLEGETLEELQDRLSHTRSSGMAKHHGLILSGVSGLAAPVFDASGVVIASVSVAYMEDRMDREALESQISGIPELATSITKRLGG